MEGIFNDVFNVNGTMFNGVYNLLNANILSGDVYPQVVTFAETLYNKVMIPIGLAFLIIFFVCTLIEKSTMEQLSTEQFFLQLAKVVVGVFVIDKGWEIMVTFQELGVSILKTIHSGNFGYTDAEIEKLNKVYTKFTGFEVGDDPKWLDIIKSLFTHGSLSLFVAWLFSLVMKVVIYIVVFMRVFEIYIRSIFAPMALADVMHAGLNSTGFRFLKSYLAVSLQVVVIYVCVILTSVFAKDMVANLNTTGDCFVFMFKYLGITAAGVGVIVQSQSLIKEILGAN